MQNPFLRLKDELHCIWIRLFGPSLRSIFESHKGPLVYKWDHYIEIYDRHFSRFRGRSIVLVEVGVFQGGSIELWKKYFGPKIKIYGVDIDSRCKQFESGNTTVILGDQASPSFWQTFKSNVPRIDIFIDDGGHLMNQQIITFQEMYHHLANGGVYVCEDLHTSYWSDYGGGYRQPGTFIEMAKNLVDQLNAWHSRTEDLKVDQISKTTTSIQFYDSMTVFEKNERAAPIARQIGKPSF